VILKGLTGLMAFFVLPDLEDGSEETDQQRQDEQRLSNDQPREAVSTLFALFT
jgi:hypothetical protein